MYIAKSNTLFHIILRDTLSGISDETYSTITALMTMQTHMNALTVLPYGDICTTMAKGIKKIAPAVSMEARPVKPLNSMTTKAAIAGIVMKVGTAVIAMAHLRMVMLLSRAHSYATISISI